MKDEDLVIWWDAYKVALGGLLASLDREIMASTISEEATKLADIALAAHQTKRDSQ